MPDATNRLEGSHEGQGEIRLRQTVQVSIADQLHTLEVAVTLAPDATPDAIAGAVQRAAIGMRQLSEGLAHHIDLLKQEHVPLIEKSTQPTIDAHPPVVAQPVATKADSSLSASSSVADTASVQETIRPSQSSSVADAMTAQETARPSKYTPTTMPAFLKAASEYGFKGPEIPKALGMEVMPQKEEFASALERLKILAQQSPATTTPIATSAPTPSAQHGFAEEIAPYPQNGIAVTASDDEDDQLDAELAAELSLLDDDDEADFGPVNEEEANLAFAPESSQPDVAPPAPVQSEEQRRLIALRAIRNAGAVPTPEQRQALMHMVIGPLGKERAQDLIMLIWNPPLGEKLNAARTRALVEWSREDDQFEETAIAIIDLARQSAAGGN